jgi:acid stress-induced BolA-like protein IbaG/YrbA
MLSPKEKLIHNIAAKYIAGKEVDIQLEGNHYEIVALHDLLEVSRKLYVKLNENTSLNEIQQILIEKKELTGKFESLTGIIWRL